MFRLEALWRKQHDLEVNGYGNHEEWLSDWRDARSDEFFTLGSRDETTGCQLCVATIAEDGCLNLRVRMPDALAEQHGKYLLIQNVWFAYGHEQVLAALQSNTEYTRYRRQHGEKAARSTKLGQAISYRFKRDGRGWRVFVSTNMMDVTVVTDRRRGEIGVDLNADHLAVAETDASGNWLNAWRVPLVTYGKSTHQAEALIGDAVAWVVEYARDAGKPIVIENLDFRQKKAVLEGDNQRYSRMLSSFQLWESQGVLHLPRLSSGSGNSSGQPGLQFSDWPGQVHGTIWAQCPSGGCPGAGPSFTWLLRADPTPAGCTRWQWRPCRLHRTCKEASEARVGVLGCDLSAAETGACSAIPAGEAETQIQSGSGWFAGSGLRSGLSGDQFGVSGCDFRAEPS